MIILTVQYLTCFALLSSVCLASDVPLDELKKWLTEDVKGLKEEYVKEFLAKIADILTSQRDHYEAQHLKELMSAKQPIVPSAEDLALIREINKTIEMDNPESVRIESSNEDLFEGDIKYNYEQMKEIEAELEADGSRTKRQAGRYFYKWDDGIVYYRFSSELHQSTRRLIEYSMQIISSKTCIDFVHSDRRYAAILFTIDDGCSSSIGYLGYEQTISIGDGCEYIGTIIHEIMHALGFLHTMSRSDRDDHVQIENGDREFLHNTRMQNTENLVPYEYGSVMHYEHQLWGGSIYPRKKEFLYTMGSDIPTFYDFQAINKFYNCYEKCGNTNVECQNGGVANPRDCHTCNCPRGFEGQMCEEPKNLLDQVVAESQWKTYSSRGGIYGYSEFDMPEHSIFIVAPINATIQVRFKRMRNFRCVYGCISNGIQIQYSPNQRYSDPINCCNSFLFKTINSTMNPTPIIIHGNGSQRYSFEYRFISNDIEDATDRGYEYED